MDGGDVPDGRAGDAAATEAGRGDAVWHAVIVYAAFAALTELGIAVQLISPTFLIVLGGVVLALTIAFGLGGP